MCSLVCWLAHNADTWRAQGDSDRIVRLRDANILHSMLPVRRHTFNLIMPLTRNLGEHLHSLQRGRARLGLSALPLHLHLGLPLTYATDFKTLQVSDYFNSWLLHIIGLKKTPP